jgi:CTP:molybdopterin cytidylyltransferase MocA
MLTVPGCAVNLGRMDIPIILLAAGSSSRMRGRDKLMEDIDGVPLLRHQAQKACAATSAPVFITLPAAPHPRYASVADLQAHVIPVPHASEGLSASLRTAIVALPAGTPAAMVLLADLPDVTVDDLQAVAAAVDLETDTLIWRGATQDGAPGHPTVFRSSLFDAIGDLTGDAGGRELMALAQGRVKMIPLDGDQARSDLDTPEDWAAWRAARKE